MNRRTHQVLASCGVVLALSLSALWPKPAETVLRVASAESPPQAKVVDPAAWGSDHVGQPLPEYMEGGECLFCHREAIGIAWATNKHNRTIREPEDDEPAMVALKANPATKELADEVQLILGDTRAQRFIKRGERYGHADLLSPVATFGRGRRARLEQTESPHWDTEKFAVRCAGCHATAVDPEIEGFATVAHDCYACHGDATAEHANDPKLMFLAQARNDSPEAITSACASCHIRNGKSKETGLPYATNFVGGDNLFKDFQVDFSVADDLTLNPGDRHVMQNIRDVVLYGRQDMTCLSCHSIHGNSSRKHQELAVEKSCFLCHDEGKEIKGNKAYEVHSPLCEY